MRNFNRPYGATRIKSFWRCWHISLSTWFKDYLYLPLGGRKKGRVRHLLAVLLVFLLSGLWHGAAWHFVFWGGIHGLFYLIEEGVRGLRRGLKHQDDRNRVGKKTWLMAKMAQGWTLLIVGLSWVFFRAQSLDHAFYLLRQVFQSWQMEAIITALRMGGWDKSLQVVLLISLLPFLNKMADKGYQSHWQEPISNRSWVLGLQLLFIISLAWLLGFENNTQNVFIYFQF